MAKIIDQYASYLLVVAAKSNQLEETYNHSLSVTDRGGAPDGPGHPEAYAAFLKIAPPADIRPILLKFQIMARKKLDILDIHVMSAAPLNESQKAAIDKKLFSVYGNRISIMTQVDPSLIGGLCIIAGHNVIDNSIKKRLADMKMNIYKGVYSKKC
jgi:F0F1-type ATP synthase delta subunit